MTCFAHAGGAGTTGADILAVETGARPIAMAGAFGAVADDASAFLYNPAGLIQMTRQEAVFTHWFELDSTTVDFLSYAFPITPKETMALGVLFRSVPEIKNTDTEPFVKVFDLVFGVSGATKLDEYFPDMSGGVTLKLVNCTLGTQSASAPALDAGLLFRGLIFNSRGAVVLQNLGLPIKFANVADPLPLNLKGAMSSQLVDDGRSDLRVSTDVNQGLDNYLKLRAGAEYWYLKFLALRAGYGMDLGGGTSGINYGAGVRYTWEWTEYRLDYAYRPFYWKSNSTPTHLVSLAVAF